MGRDSIDNAAALGTQPVGRLLWHSCSQTTLSVGIFGVYALTNAWFVARGVSASAMGAVNLVAPLLLERRREAARPVPRPCETTRLAT